MQKKCNKKEILINTRTLIIALVIFWLTSCTTPPPSGTMPTQPITAPVSTDMLQANMPTPSAYCVEQGYKSEIRTAANGNQSGVCIFPDGSECDEWAYVRGECGPANQSGPTSSPTEIRMAIPINPADYRQGWWTYTYSAYNFSIMLPEDWVVEEITTFDPLMSGHALNLHLNYGNENIRMTFRRAGETCLCGPPAWVRASSFSKG